MTTNNIENRLAALKPAGQSTLARRILAIPHRRRQRRRDCLVGLAGLLTGITATVLVMMYLPARTVEVPVVEFVVKQEPVIPAQAGNQTEYVAPARLDSRLCGNDATTDPFDLDAWIVRYEKLLRNRQITAKPSFVDVPVVMPGGISPLEYRNRLLEECRG
jgi:hypothetical protein